MEDYPIASIPQTPHWSENFCFAGFDPKAGVGLFAHVGRWRRDLGLWREIIMIALPDGSVAGHRGIGNARAVPTGPGGGNLAVDVIEPGRRFRLRFAGSAERVAGEWLLANRSGGGAQMRLAFDLAYEGVTPVWDLSKVGDKTEFMGAGHVEQLGTLVGHIEIGDERHDFDSVVNRDHSRGPRVVDSNIRHSWLHGSLEDGVRFQLYEAEAAGHDGPAFSEVNVIENGVAHAGRVTIHDKLPFVDNRALLDSPVRFTLDYDGKVLDITAEQFPCTMHCQSTSPWDFYVGCAQQGSVQNATVAEQSVLYRMSDGRRGYGHMERLVPGRLVVDPP